MASIKKKPTTINKELQGQLARALADYSNLEKRFAKESSSVIKFANSSLLQKILEVKDNLERASHTIQDEGIDLVLAQLENILVEEQVTEIKVSDFDPELMECEEVVAGKKNHIIEIIQKGYMLHDRVLRQARVKVGNGITK